MLAIFLSLLLLVAIGCLWADSLRVREAALCSCRQYCAAHDLQFLDGTVSMSHFELKLGRGRYLGIGLRRVYEFEFSRAGTDRDRGSITLTGGVVEAVYLPLFDDPERRP